MIGVLPQAPVQQVKPVEAKTVYLVLGASVAVIGIAVLVYVLAKGK
jgi:hypothetical protein